MKVELIHRTLSWPVNGFSSLQDLECDHLWLEAKDRKGGLLGEFWIDTRGTVPTTGRFSHPLKWETGLAMDADFCFDGTPQDMEAGLRECRSVEQFLEDPRLSLSNVKRPTLADLCGSAQSFHAVQRKLNEPQPSLWQRLLHALRFVLPIRVGH